MTSQEAENFINTELKGLWPDWNPTDAEFKLWSQELIKVDYFPTKSSIDNWYIRQTTTYKRPRLGRLRPLFKKIISEKERREQNEPVLLYTIVKESDITQRSFKDLKTGEKVEYTSMPGQRFTASRPHRLPADPQIIESEADRMRERFNDFYGGNHIIVRNWEKWYS